MIEDIWVGSVAWWHTVTPEFAFLLGLPFAVAAAGWAVDGLWRHRRTGAASDGGLPPGDPGP